MTVPLTVKEVDRTLEISCIFFMFLRRCSQLLFSISALKTMGGALRKRKLYCSYQKHKECNNWEKGLLTSSQTQNETKHPFGTAQEIFNGLTTSCSVNSTVISRISVEKFHIFQSLSMYLSKPFSDFTAYTAPSVTLILRFLSFFFSYLRLKIFHCFGSMFHSGAEISGLVLLFFFYSILFSRLKKRKKEKTCTSSTHPKFITIHP